MEIKKTDSLGFEILNQISKNEYGNAIKPCQTKEEAVKKLDENKITLFIIFEGKMIKEYFTLETKIYNMWIKEYKLEGVEI